MPCLSLKSATYKQDLPPKGGYSPFEYAKKTKTRWAKGKWLILAYMGYQGMAYYLNDWQFKVRIRMPELENREAYIAMEPLLLAERNRLFLKQMVKNREDEKELMKDVPGWIPGTFYGTPVFHNKSCWHDPDMTEFYAHVPLKVMQRHQFERLRHI